MTHASLNHVYRLVWNEITGACVAVAEHTAARGKRSRASRALPAALLLGAAALAQAQGGAAPPGSLPTGGQITTGQGRIAHSGTTLTVTQGSERMIVDWGRFDIGAGAGVRFVQPGRDSIALNRVTGGSASRIDGSLSANGQVWLLNPGGVVFGAGARVDVGGLVASSLALSDRDFLAGRYQFQQGRAAGAVVNQGRIDAQGGIVALLGPQVRNEGTIETPGGSTALAAGDSVRLALADDGLLAVSVERGVVEALADNSGRIGADGGLVVLSARGAGRALDSVVNNTGLIEAQGLVERGGRILLDGDAQAGSARVAGTLDVSSAQGRGGEIAVTGRDLVLGSGARLEASGARGGGRIRVGGGWQGGDADLAHATTVVADAGTVLRADATAGGDGGQVVVWSDGSTAFAGQVSARGGPQGGDGGQLEVSGRQTLQYRGRADARAPHGRTGDLLLDPATITVRGGGSGSGAISGSVVYEKDLEAQNANVLLEATGSTTVEDLNLNGGDGSITMAPDVSFRIESGMGCPNTTGCSHLTFDDATDTIEVFGTGSIYLQSGGNGWGDIVNVPNLIAHGAGSNPGVMPTHDVTVAGSGTPGAGSITIYGADGVSVGGSLQTNGGYVRVWSDADDMGFGGFTIASPVSTNGGNFLVSAGNGSIELNSNMTLGTGRILFRVDGSHTSGTKVLGGTLQASGNVDVDTRFQMNAGASIYTDGTITFSDVVDLNTGSGALTLRADSIDFSAATLNNLGTASMVLQPADPATSMVLGDASGFASATTLAKLPGIRNLTIGRSDGTGTTSVAADFSFDANGTLEIINRTIDIGGGSLTNTTGHITLTGDNLSIGHPVSADGGDGTVTIRQMTAGTDLHLGSTLPSSATQQVDAATLVIGRVDGGDLVFDADVQTSAGTVSLLAGGRVLGVDGGVSAPNLAVTAGGGATLSDSTFDYTTLALKVGGDTQVTRSGTLNLGTVAGVAGLSIDADSDAAVTLQADAIDGTGPIALADNDSTMTLRADSVDLTDIPVSGQTFSEFVVEPLTAGASFSVGGAGSLIDSASLSRLDASLSVTVGRHDGTGQLDVTGNLSMSLPGELTLVNGTVRVVSGTVANDAGDLTLEARTGSLLIDRDVAAGSTLTLAAATGGTIGGDGAVAADELAIDASGAAVTLLAAANAVDTIGANVASLDYRQAGDLVVGFAGNQMGVQAAQWARLRTTGATADLTLDLGVDSWGTGDTVQLVAGRHFINNAGGGGIVAPNGRWLVWSSDPAGDTRGGLAPDFKQYDASYGDTALGIGNGFLHEIAPLVTVGLTGSTGKVYDGGTEASLADGNFTISGLIDGDSIDLEHGDAQYDTRHVGTGKAVTATGLSLTDGSNGSVVVFGYQLAAGSATGNIGSISRATLSVGSASVNDRVYDGSTTATVTGVALGGVIAGDSVGTSASGSFADRHVGQDKTVSVSGISLTGADAGNYQLAATTTTGQADITPASLSVTGAAVASRVYDGSTVATVTGLVLDGLIDGDEVEGVASGRFADKNAGRAKSVAVVVGSLAGADAGNYVIADGSTTGQADITPATLTLGGARVADKPFDGNTRARVGALDLVGIVAGDEVRGSASGAFADASIGRDKPVAVSGVTIEGADAGNYVLASTGTTARASIVSAGAGSTTTVSSDALASLVGAQPGLNGTFDGSATVGIGGLNGAIDAGDGPAGGAAGGAAGGGDGALAANAGRSTRGPASAGSAGQTRLTPGLLDAGSAGAAGVAPADSAVATGSLPPLTLPQTVLTQGRQVSIALAGPDTGGTVADAATARGGAAAPAGQEAQTQGASLPVYSLQPGGTARDEGQYLVSESGGSLSLLADGQAQVGTPSAEQAVQRSARANLPLSADVSVTMQVDLLADGTLLVSTPAQAGVLTPDTLATYGLLVARKALSVPLDGVKAVLLRTSGEDETEAGRAPR